MSSRALRKLQGANDLELHLPAHQQSHSADDQDEAVDDVPVQSKLKKKRKKKEKSATVNPFEVLNDVSDQDIALNEQESGEEERIVLNKENTDSIEVSAGCLDTDQKGAKAKKKKKKKKKQNKHVEENSVKNDILGEDEIEASVREVNALLGELPTTDRAYAAGIGLTTDMRALLSVEHKHLNPDNEMRRMFGSRVVQTNQSVSRQGRQRNQRYHKSTKLARPKDNWPHFGKTGLTMSLVETANHYQIFTFEHNKQYQQVQFEFWEAVETLEPQNILNVLHRHPYHIDTLLQVSEICKMSEDVQMATEIIERALYVFECSFHPSFNLASGSCRLDYRKPENRAFFIAIFRHVLFVGQRGCYRTSLEFCKLLLSLEPDGDPLCVLLMMDFYALRASEYSFLVRTYHEWEAHRNLSQLPNYAFSVPLAMFHVCQEEGSDTAAADDMLQKSLIMFPGLLMPLLNSCSIVPDAQVTAHAFFGTQSQLDQPKALEQLVNLYIGRCNSCWKVPEVVTWLEKNVKEVLARVDSGDSYVQECKQKRKVRYTGTPRNIYRHILMSEIKEASASLPPEIANSPILSYDPLPPTNAIISYTKPERRRTAGQDAGALSMFFRSLLPNFNPQAQEEEEEVAGAAGGRDLRQGIVTLMDSLRDLLNNIQPAEAPVENQEDDNQNGPGEYQPDEWD